MKYNKIEDIPRSNYVKIIEGITIKIEKPFMNMQTDAANFESLALICKCINPSAHITIQFDIYAEWDGKFNKKSSEVNTYLRFLERVIMFNEAFPEWTSIAPFNKAEIFRFKELLNEAIKEWRVSNNIPDKDAKFNPSGKEEQIIESILVHTTKGSAYLKQLYNKKYSGNELLYVHNQLPNGLFNIRTSEKPSEHNRIFTTGAYDIWGIDKNNNFCVFELKKNEENAHLGVLSELFFYSVYAYKFLLNKTILHDKKNGKHYRGYEQLYDAVQADQIKGIKAIFLLGKEVYPLIRERQAELKTLLNTNKFGISYDFMDYDMAIISNLLTEELNK